MRLRDIWQRIYADFLMPSKLDAYRAFLQHFINCKYKVCSVAFLWDKIKNGGFNLQEKYLVLRHDIDTDTTTAREIWNIERDLGLTSSYYFRLSTVDTPFMRAIELSGGEASYHFEELATVAKQKRLKTCDQVLREMPYIREIFRSNLDWLREETGLPMRIVSSHGDFVNRKLGFCNWEILKEESFRRSVGVELEVYDNTFMRHVTSRHSEVLPPQLWEPQDPFNAAENGNRVIYVLVHPRNWQANRKENLQDNVKRAWEGFCYSL